MRLKAIKLSGFKSFVDPTTVSFTTNMTGIVGPNGCGKSNTIDAVRWVMGESSAKYLRGDAMTDVIFNGSTERKPVSKASVELMFDNTDRTLRGEYASYNEISVRRQVSRDGQSQYFLNGSRCRRRDVTDLFLGTGLGPRSYAIIEQGMISRLIEAKPDELRVYVEEAAGISRYKDRRRETENRMRRTGENLERLQDIRDELERQLVHLERQAEAAEKYKGLKADERQKKAELLALKWQALDADFQDREAVISEVETAVEGRIAEQTAFDTQMEEVRLRVTDYSDAFQEAQGVFYDLGSRIARQEQKLEHQAQMALQLDENLAQVEQSLTTNRLALEKDDLAITEAREQLEFVDEELALLSLQQEEQEQTAMLAEERWDGWQESWNGFTEKAGAPARQSEVSRTRIQSLQQQLESLRRSLERRQQEREQLQLQADDDELPMLEAELAEQELLLESAVEQEQHARESLVQARQHVTQGREALEADRQRLSQLVQRKATLEALQKVALGNDNQAGVRWLESHQLARKPRLSSALHVDSGWEVAVETVLGTHLNAVMVDDLNALVPLLDHQTPPELCFWQRTDSKAASGRDSRDCLSSKVRANGEIVESLASVRVAESLESALALRSALTPQESVILPDGTWLGANWLQLPGSADEDGSLLQRQQELEQVTEEWDLLDMEVEERSADLDGLQLRIHSQEQEAESAAGRTRECQSRLSELSVREASLRAQLNQRSKRLEDSEQEIAELQEQKQLLLEELEMARMDEQEALSLLEAFASERDQLQSQRDGLQRALSDARQSVTDVRQKAHQQQLVQQQLRSQIQGFETARQRLLQEREHLQERQRHLVASQDQDHQQELDLIQAELQQLLEQRQLAEQRMAQERQRLEEAESTLKGLDEKRQSVERQVMDLRNRLESVRLECQALTIRRQTLIEQLSEDGLTLKEVIECLSSDANVEEWQKALTSIAEKIRRLGAINLAAIDEFQRQSERKQYLDAQHHDLLTALETLEGAIVRIDRETRARFRETFETINSGLSELFPRVFGGGNAWLELTDDDLLTTGVAIMARPPGKKNSTIHLLSGGEKALTAIALVFSIFQLNPAPFCMLDEVDAPLDDANVGRYGRLVKAMSDRVQFIYITHNKIAMEMASDLLGVTMQEPGVSRLVSVSVDQAADMVD